LLNEDALNATPAQIGSEGKPDQSPANNQHRCFMR
jgi:hypothetical protein